MDKSKVRADLASPDEATVISALHRACPCSGSPLLYEELMPVLARFKKDPRPAVRKIALHLEVDALEHLAMADERAGGFVRNRGTSGSRRGELRRTKLRYDD